jgi:phosphoglycolate phosphatase
LKVRVILTDLDGTLTEDRGSYLLNLEAIEALRKAEAKGIKVALVSGNSYPVLRGLYNYLGFSGGVVAENGCLVYYQGNIFPVCTPLPKVLVEEFRDKFKLKESWQNEYRRYDFGFTPPVITDDMRKWAEEKGVTIQSSGYALHISGRPGGKGAGVKKLLNLLGVKSEDVAAIGDSATDIEMLEIAGVRVAVANADENLKRVANFTLKLKSGDGVKEFIDSLTRE